MMYMCSNCNTTFDEPSVHYVLDNGRKVPIYSTCPNCDSEEYFEVNTVRFWYFHEQCKTCKYYDEDLDKCIDDATEEEIYNNECMHYEKSE